MRRLRRSLKFFRFLRRQNAEPKEVVWTKGEQVRQLADRREAVFAPQLQRHHPVKFAQVELNELGKAREIVDAEDRLVLVAADEDQHAPIGGIDRLPGAAA